MNTAMINVFLKQLAQRVGPQEQTVMIWDGAGFHCIEAPQMPASITPIQLPAHSPD
jgi:hypothetical protein